MKCKYCGADLDNSNKYCPNCGSNNPNYKEPEEEIEEDIFEAEPVQKSSTKEEREEKEDTRPPRSKLVAGLLAILLGGIGIQAFYLGRITRGIFSIIFSWTGIPAFIGVIEGVVILVGNTKDFEERYHVRNTDREDY